MIIKDMKMLLVPSKLVWITGGEAALIPKQVECYLKRSHPQPAAHSPQPAARSSPGLTRGPAFNNSRSLQSKKHKGNLLWFSPHSEALRKLKRATFFPPAKNKGGKRILLCTLPHRHAGYNEVRKKGPLTGHFKSPALSHIFFLSFFAEFTLVSRFYS